MRPSLNTAIAVGAIAIVTTVGGRTIMNAQQAGNKIETAIVSGDIAFRQHSSGHTPGPNWPVFLDFAARYFDAPATKASGH